jgi:hypothetical protein
MEVSSWWSLDCLSFLEEKEADLTEAPTMPFTCGVFFSSDVFECEVDEDMDVEGVVLTFLEVVAIYFFTYKIETTD